MKIISSYKDYYDYLQGQYGIDEKIVYTRQCGYKDKNGIFVKTAVLKPDHIAIKNYTTPYIETLAICGKLYFIGIYNNQCTFGAEILSREEFKHCRPQINIEEYHLSDTDINEKENCPVVCIKIWWGQMQAGFHNPKLSDFGINHIIPAHDMYIMISNFLSREKKIEDKRTDVEKIVTHGFDKKTSFRKM